MLMKLFATLLAGAFAWSPVAQAPAPASVKLYIFDCGHLKSGNPDVLTARGVTTTDMSVTAYLIVHPRGTLLWDTGVIPDELVKPEGTVEARALTQSLRSFGECQFLRGFHVARAKGGTRRNVPGHARCHSQYGCAPIQ